MNIFRFIKKLPLTIILILTSITLLAYFILFTLPVHQVSHVLGENLGKGTGMLVGQVIGSHDGITNGLDAGKKLGLSAEDTTAKIANVINDIGKLEVLVAGVRLKNMHTVGDKYSALYLLKGNAVFTIDLMEAVISKIDDELVVLIPLPTMDLYLDVEETEKLAEQQNTIFDGSAKGGYDAYLNTMKKTLEEVEETMVGYDNLMNLAEESAIKQIEMLVNAASGQDNEIHISFKE